MIGEVFTAKFVQDLSLVLTGVVTAGVALWTWQRAYWEYQLRRQTEDWKQRQSYSRKEARRQAMEGLLVELNEATEKHLTATLLAISAIVRSRDYAASAGSDESGKASWQQEVNDSVAQFNASERQWLVDSAVLAGKLRLHFESSDGPANHAWDGIAKVMQGFCTLLSSEETLNELLGMIQGVRQKKDKLLIRLQREIDQFTVSQLDVGPSSRNA
jgi:hypothetical protein